MKLLIVTQKIDINDDILGFMHGWVAEFARHCEKITVIALGAGEHRLPGNVKVLSLGKEGRQASRFSAKIAYAVNFYRHIWRERRYYDSVLVHMNQEYAILGGPLWRLLGKRTGLWRNHPFGGWPVGIAALFANDIFCTSRFAFVMKYKKTKLMPVGVDTDFFKPDPEVVRAPSSILFFSRISPIKKPDILIDALKLLNKEGFDFSARIIGDAPERDKEYLAELRRKTEESGLAGKIEFKKGVPFRESPAVYNQNEIFVNLTPAGSLDKVILEAMACQTQVLMANESLAGELPASLFFDGTAGDLAGKLRSRLALDEETKRRETATLRDYVVKRHSLAVLADKLVDFLSRA